MKHCKVRDLYNIFKGNTERFEKIGACLCFFVILRLYWPLENIRLHKNYFTHSQTVKIEIIQLRIRSAKFCSKILLKSENTLFKKSSITWRQEYISFRKYVLQWNHQAGSLSCRSDIIGRGYIGTQSQQHERIEILKLGIVRRFIDFRN